MATESPETRKGNVMRKVALGVAAIALMAAPGIAHADTNAVVGIDYNNVNFPGVSPDADVYGLSGAFNHGFNGAWNVQMDGYAGRVSEDGCCLSTNYAAAHLGVREQNYSAAGFIGLQTFALYSGVDVGAEGQLFFSQAMLEGSIGYTDWSDVDLNATNAQVDGSWFLSPDFSLNALVGYTNADWGGSSQDYWSYGVSGEYRFANSPASVSLGYRQADDSGSHVDTWSIALNLDLGTGTLQERTQSGPSWNGARSMYDNFDRVSGIIPLVSDRRLKRDITLVATLASGMKIYSFRYLWSDEMHVGVMAQDLLANPAWRRAVVTQASGFYAVNYGALGLRMTSIDDWRRNGVAAVLLEGARIAA
jgi:Chaperone of endosialidase